MHATKKTIASLLPGLVLVAVGCGPVAFQGNTGLKVVGELPAPPPPPPPPPPKPVAKPPAPRKVEIVANKIIIREKVQFAYDKAEILTVSHSLLDEVVKVMQDNPHVKKVRVEGYASDEGRGAAANQYNKVLSDNRAKAVMVYMVAKGVDQKRLEAKGYGVEKPIASNDTDEGRIKNRRVEFNILEQDDVKKSVPAK